MKTLLFGSNGQLGRALRSHAAFGTLIPITRSECDLRDENALRQTIQSIEPDIILNAAAFTAVDKAESEVAECMALNALAPGIMAAEAEKVGALLVHYSTDYVFDGNGTVPYTEEDLVNPINQYGKSKLAGERAIQATNARHLIFRTSWVFSAHGTNFVKTMLRLGRERDRLRVVSDQVGGPTSAKALAEATARILAEFGNSVPAGLYHMSAAGTVSWAGFAEEIFRIAAPDHVPVVEPISSEEYPTPAKRPKNSRLSNGKFAAQFGFRLSDWREQLREVLTELAPQTTLQNLGQEGDHRR